MNVEVAPAALREVREAADWYEARQAGLGADLVDAFDEGLRSINERPHAWHPLGRNLRRFRLVRFPYGIIYHLRHDLISVVAFAHQRRRPRYWRSRLAGP